MAKKKENHLGSGLDAIFGQDLSNVIEDIQNNAEDKGLGRRASIDVNAIMPNPYQPRKSFDQQALQDLADSIKQVGVFTPILVRQSTAGKYVLIAGERRLRASILAGLKEIPALVVDFTDQQMMEVSLLENVQRQDLSPIEEAQGYSKLMTSMHYTQEQLAGRVGKSREYVANMLRLLKLPANVQNLVQTGKLTVGQVRPLIGLSDAKEISNWAGKIASLDLSARQVEMMLKNQKDKPQAGRKTKESDPALKDVQRKMARRLATKVAISDQSILISYKDTADLNRILEILGFIDE